MVLVPLLKGSRRIQVAICIPARNEAKSLPALFAALENLDLGGVDISVCMLLDSCTDESVKLTSGYQSRSRHRILYSESRPTPANAGRARHRAMALGLAAMIGRDGLLLSTDADCVPAPDWVRSMVSALRAADVVAGRIVRHGGSPCLLQERVETYYDRLLTLRRRLDPVPWEAEVTHHHTGGANLGMRDAAYADTGGFLPLSSGEDARFVDDASRAGLRVRRDAACLVRTSDRRRGRAGGGLAVTLRHLDRAMARTIVVSHPEDVSWQYAMHAKARRAFHEGRFDQIALALGLTFDHALGVARDAPNAEAFAMRIVPVPPSGMRELTLPEAEAELDRLEVARRAA